MMSLPIRKRRMKAMLTEPTSPAKHLARLRKLKKAEDKNGTDNGIDEIRFHKSNHLLIDISQRSKNNQRITTGYAVNAIHKVVGIDDARTDYQGYDYPPPGQGETVPTDKTSRPWRRNEKAALSSVRWILYRPRS